MKIIYNSILPFGRFIAINPFGIVFVKKGNTLSSEIKNHEAIHTAQIKELLIIGFYVWYILEWLWKIILYGKTAYYHISFEREAYANATNKSYLSKRKTFAFIFYLKKDSIRHNTNL